MRISKNLPAPVRTACRFIKASCTCYRDAYSQAHRFNRSYARLSGNKEQVGNLLVFYSHQIEKGLSHLQFRKGFGKNPLRNLGEAMTRYRELDAEYLRAEPYGCALAAIKEYIKRDSDCPGVIEYLKAVMPQGTVEEACNVDSLLGGSVELERAAKIPDRGLTFPELARARRSVREYAQNPVTMDELWPVLETAVYAPSACNRQPSRVRVLLDENQIGEALRIQGGFGGYALPPALLLITADNRCFVGPQERNEGFTDAGMFAMGLLYALEDAGLAACPLNTMMKRKQELRTRLLLNVPNWENLVMYIAVGHFPDVVRTCRSHRLAARDITTVL